jgi:hypothetical protein
MTITMPRRNALRQDDDHKSCEVESCRPSEKNTQEDLTEAVYVKFMRGLSFRT